MENYEGQKYMRFISLLSVFVLIGMVPIAKSDISKEVIYKEHFNVEKFNQRQKNGVWVQTLSDGTTLQQRKNSPQGFIEEKKNKDSPYIYRKAFDTNGNLIGVSTEFYSFPVGVSILYDSQGKVIREDNHDNDFNFSVENLADKMNKEFGINIMNSNNVINIVRGMEQEHIKEPIYIIYAHINDKPGYIRNYLVSGRTGRILLVLDSSEEEPKSVIDEYLNTRKN